MLRNAFTKWLWDWRRSVLGWSLAIALVGGFYAAFWPSFDSPELQQALESYPEALLDALNYNDISTAAGYLNATVYGLLSATLLIVYAVAAGTRLIAGDEDAGTLDLVLAHPVGRTRLGWQRFGALAASVGVISLALLLVLLALVVPVGLDGISLAGFLAMHLHLAAFGVLFGGLAYAVGAATGRRGLSFAVGAAVGVFGFIANGLVAGIEGWEWIRRLSPYHWLNGGDPLVNGLRVGDVSLMLGIAVVLAALGTWAFGRRDVAV